MKRIIISSFARVLAFIARLHVARFHPRIVGVTGNAGKTSTKDAIAAVLASKYRVRATGGNFNNELGLPTTILGDFSAYYARTGGTLGFWSCVLIGGVLNLFRSRSTQPEILVLEYGADHPGDIKRLVSRFRPHVAVVTQVGEVPVHVEYFASALHLAQEKMQLIKHLGLQDHAVLNYDDQTVLDMKSHTQAHVHTFGTAHGAETQATGMTPWMDGALPLGIRFDIVADGHTMPAVVTGTVGRGIATSCAAAVAVGRIFAIGLADAVSALSRLRPPAGRMRILRGIKDTVIIDDTYNASPSAMHLALETVKELPGTRHVLVLGDMLELGEHTVAAHQAVGTMAAQFADVLVCVGERARFYADAAGNQMPADRIFVFHDSIEAAPKVQQLIKAGDIILVKASQGKRMERITKEIMAEPERAAQLLVRQSARWRAK